MQLKKKEKKGKKLYTKQQQSPLTTNDCHLEDHETMKPTKTTKTSVLRKW